MYCDKCGWFNNMRDKYCCYCERFYAKLKPNIGSFLYNRIRIVRERDVRESWGRRTDG